MAGLNDDIDADDDIENELPGSPKNPVRAGEFFVPHPEELATGSNQPVAPKINIVVDQPPVDDNGDPVKPTARDLFGQDIVPNELPDLNAEIIFVDEIANKITDASGVYQDITSARAISQESILEIDSILPGYLNENEIIEYYTKTPTLTRYETATNQIGYQIAKQQIEHDKLAVDIFDRLQASVENTIVYIQEHLLNDREKVCSTLRDSIIGVNEQFIEGSLTQTKEALKAAWNNPVTELSQSSFKELSIPAQAIVDLLEKSTALNKLLISNDVLDQEEVFAHLKDPDIHAEKTITLSVCDLAEKLTQSSLTKTIEHLQGILISSVAYIKEASFAVTDKEANDIGKDPEPLQTLKRESKALIDVSVIINDLVGCHRKTYQLLGSLVSLCNSGI